MRLFISIEPPGPAKERLFALQKELKLLGRGRFTPAENLHLTLAFLGETPSGQVDTAQDAMARAAGRAFSLCISRLGCFHRPEGDIVWAGPEPSVPLSALQRRLCRELSAEGFDLPKRPFAPHITLARRMAPDMGPALSSLTLQAFSLPAEDICLMRSCLGAEGPVYEELFRLRLR